MLKTPRQRFLLLRPLSRFSIQRFRFPNLPRRRKIQDNQLATCSIQCFLRLLQRAYFRHLSQGLSRMNKTEKRRSVRLRILEPTSEKYFVVLYLRTTCTTLLLQVVSQESERSCLFFLSRPPLSFEFSLSPTLLLVSLPGASEQIEAFARFVCIAGEVAEGRR